MTVWPPEFGPRSVAHHTANGRRLRQLAINAALADLARLPPRLCLRLSSGLGIGGRHCQLTDNLTGNGHFPMQIDLTGKRAVISGSTLGIGFAIAKGLAQAGARVVVNGRSEASTTKARDRLLADLPNAEVDAVAADLATADGVARFIEQVPNTDILVNNLGIFEPKAFDDIPDADWMRFFETNVMSGIRLSRAYAPAMRQNNWGRIVFISSESGLSIPGEMVHYGMTKTAQLAVSRGLATSLSGTGVTVNAVLPGPTRSEGVADFFGKIARDQGKSQADVERDFIATHRPSSIIKRLAEVDEVANLVVYVCSQQASATTGAALRVDGGVVNTIG